MTKILRGFQQILPTLWTVEFSCWPVQFILRLMILGLFAWKIRWLAHDWFINNEKPGPVPESVHRPVSIRACDEPWNSPFKIKTHQNLPVLPQPVCTSSTINNALNCEQNYHTCKKEVPKYKIHVLNAEIAKNFTVLQGKETFYFHFANIACIIEQYYMKNSGTPPRGHRVHTPTLLLRRFKLVFDWIEGSSQVNLL